MKKLLMYYFLAMTVFSLIAALVNPVIFLEIGSIMTGVSFFGFILLATDNEKAFKNSFEKDLEAAVKECGRKDLREKMKKWDQEM